MKKPNSLLLTRKRLLIVILSIAFLFCALSVRLFYLQIIKGSWLSGKAAEQWYRDLPLEAPRGKILDTNGEVLADNRNVYTVYVRPRAVRDFDAVSRVLANELALDYSKLYDKLSGTFVSEITVMRQVEEDVAERIRAHELDGIYFTVDSTRNYPGGSRLEQVLGFTNIDNIGQNGLEGYYDKYLSGIDGVALTPTDMQGIRLDGDTTKYVPAIPGCDMTLTVDANIQSFAETAVTSAQLEWNSKSASMIVMDVNTGGILAMASAPSYDNNEPPRNDINLLNALSKNKMIVDVYEPGSTFKIFTTAIALANGVVSDSDRFYCPGYRMVDGQRIKCWRSIGHGSQTLDEGVMNSCNCVFMDLAQRVGTEKLYEGLRNFGFGQKTNVDFYGESRGILMNEASVKTVDLARIGFGQAVAVTPLQLITGVCAAVNGGILYEPYFVSSIDSCDGLNVYTREKKEVRRVIDEETSVKLRGMLEKVVSSGGGKKAGVAGFTVGGKTGTAQKYEDGHIAQGKYISSFVGFAPADNPRYAVLMIVDEPDSYAYYGSIVAAPYAGKVFENLFAYVGMAPTTEAPQATVPMPDVVGLSLSEALRRLKEAGLQCEIAGDTDNILGTMPAAGTLVPVGDIVLVRTAESGA